MNEMGKLLSEARDVCIKIESSQKVTSSELESLFKIYGCGNKEKDLSSSTFETIIESVNYVVENILLNFLCEGLKGGRGSFADILADDILHGKTTLKGIIDDPCGFLSNNIKINDEKVRVILNNLLSKKINEELNNPDSLKFESLDISDLQNILEGLESVDYLRLDAKNNIRSAISLALCGKVSLELEKVLEKFRKDVTEAIRNSNPTFDAKLYKKEFIDKIRELEDEKVVRGTQLEKFLQECKTSFESEFDQSLGDLINSIIERKLADELYELNNEREIDNYVKSVDGTVYAINILLNEINKEEIKTELDNKLNDKIKAARLICKSKPPKVKTIIDDDGIGYAIFKTEKFPIINYEERIKEMKMRRKSSVWKIEPEILPDGNVLITFKDHVSGKTIRPSASKRLRGENSYELSKEERKELQKQIKHFRQPKELTREILELQGTIEAEKDKAVREKLREQLREKIQEYIEKIPFYLRVRDLLMVCYRYASDDHSGDIDYIKGKIPDFDPDTIKLTPDIMENLREIAECSATQLKSKSGGLIIEGEAGVGKNLLIDIFAHFTNRPVFVFACGKKTDSHDLTSLWILDEKGSKKLDSKVYEAISTPGAILVLDEINTLDAGVIKMLNGLFDKRRSLVSPEAGGKDVKALDDVLIFGTMNPVSYSGTQQIPQDVSSRFHFISQDYDWMFKEDGGISYGDALIAYGNVNYFWKLASGNGMKKEDIKLYEEALLDKKMGNKLSKKKQEILERFKPISDADFIWAWNQLFIAKNEWKVVDEFGLTFVEGMKDIYTIVLFSNYIRMRHKIKQLGIESKNLPRDDETDDLFEEKSFSPRLTIQALEQLSNGNEISSAKEAVIQTYIQQISDVKKRNKIATSLMMMTNEILEEQLKNKEVQKILFAQKFNAVDVL